MKDKTKTYSINFSRTVPEYKLNKATMEIEVVGEIDLQEQIESNMIEPLEKIFDKFMGVDTEVKHQKMVIDRRVDKLDLALKSINELENIREAYKLPLEYSHQEIVDYVLAKSKEYDQKVEFMKDRLSKTLLEDKTKGVGYNEKISVDKTPKQA